MTYEEARKEAEQILKDVMIIKIIAFFFCSYLAFWNFVRSRE